MIYLIEEDGQLPQDIANGGGIATNRNAIGPLTAQLPDEAAMGDRYEVHSVTAETLSIALPAGHVFRHGGVAARVVHLRGGGALVATRTTPGVWTGLLSGSFDLDPAEGS